MRLETALTTSCQGLNVHGQAISVIGDNISNANTIGYRTSRSEFADILAGTVTPNGISNGTTCGARMQCVRQMQENGVIESTGRGLDAAIQGHGFFIVGDPASPKLTRAGNFQISRDGFLETSTGNHVLGLTGDNAELGDINLYELDLGGKATTAASLGGNLSSRSAVTAVPANPTSFKELDTAATFSTSMQIYDSLGESRNVSIYFSKTGTNTWTAQAYIDTKDTGSEDSAPKLIGQTNIKFDEYGKITEGNTLTATATFTGAAASNINFDFSNMTQYATASNISNADADGQAAGNVTEYGINDKGEITATLDSGWTTVVAKLQIARVQNVDGLSRDGDGLFAIGNNVGEITIGTPGEAALGTIEGGALENSTVDMANEFVKLVLMQRGYEANSKVLSQVSDMVAATIALIS